MIFLSLESVSSSPSASIFIDNKHVDTCQIKNVNSSHLAIIVDKILKNNKLKIDDLNYIALTIGPGSFTGIRVGLSLAQGLAYSAGIGIAPIDVMDVLAYQIENKEKSIIAFYSHANFIFCRKIDIKKAYTTTLLNINDIIGKNIFGINLEKFDNLINYKKLKFSSEQVGKYSIENYDNLITDKIEFINPIYLNEFQINGNI